LERFVILTATHRFHFHFQYFPIVAPNTWPWSSNTHVDDHLFEEELIVSDLTGSGKQWIARNVCGGRNRVPFLVRVPGSTSSLGDVGLLPVEAAEDPDGGLVPI
jgi:hypothetical protein